MTKKFLLSLKFFPLRMIVSLVLLPFGIIFGIMDAFYEAWRMSFRHDIAGLFNSIIPYIKDVCSRKYWEKIDEANKTDTCRPTQ